MRIKALGIACLLLFASGAYDMTVSHRIPEARAAAATCPHLSSGKSKLKSGKYTEAIEDLKKAVEANPRSCEAHSCLGQAYAGAKNYKSAKTHLRTAIRVGRGSPAAQDANRHLMKLPIEHIKPRTGPETRFISRILGVFFRDRGATVGEGARPTVMCFEASWCVPCNKLSKVIEKAKTSYGEKVEFLSINVDDPDNDKIVDQYGVSPIPTVVFINPDGEVVSYAIGFSGEKIISSGIEKILTGAS